MLGPQTCLHCFPLSLRTRARFKGLPAFLSFGLCLRFQGCHLRCRIRLRRGLQTRLLLSLGLRLGLRQTRPLFHCFARLRCGLRKLACLGFLVRPQTSHCQGISLRFCLCKHLDLLGRERLSS